MMDWVPHLVEAGYTGREMIIMNVQHTIFEDCCLCTYSPVHTLSAGPIPSWDMVSTLRGCAFFWVGAAVFQVIKLIRYPGTQWREHSSAPPLSAAHGGLSVRGSWGTCAGITGWTKQMKPRDRFTFQESRKPWSSSETSKKQRISEEEKKNNSDKLLVSSGRSSQSYELTRLVRNSFVWPVPSLLVLSCHFPPRACVPQSCTAATF